MIEAAMVRDGKIPTVLWIFRSKNYLGMKDVQQVEVTPTASGDIPQESEQILEALPEAPVENFVEIESEVSEKL